jgi:group I intron endonuclease
MGTIYILKNKLDGKCYIGQTIQKVYNRLRDHRKAKSYIGNALRMYGEENFERIIIENVPDDELDELEKKKIIEYNSLVPNGYNLDSGGNLNKHHHEETKKKMSKHMIENNPMKDLEIRKKVGEANKGRIPWNKGLEGAYSEEHIKKLSDARIGKSTSRKGTKLSEEWCKNLSEAHKGQKAWNEGLSMSEETKNRISASKLGKKISYPKSRKPRIGTVFDEEARKHMSESHKGQIPWNKGKKKAS